MAQWLRRLTSNQAIPGSTPGRGFSFSILELSLFVFSLYGYHVRHASTGPYYRLLKAGLQFYCKCLKRLSIASFKVRVIRYIYANAMLAVCCFLICLTGHLHQGFPDSLASAKVFNRSANIPPLFLGFASRSNTVLWSNTSGTGTRNCRLRRGWNSGER